MIHFMLYMLYHDKGEKKTQYAHVLFTIREVLVPDRSFTIKEVLGY